MRKLVLLGLVAALGCAGAKARPEEKAAPPPPAPEPALEVRRLAGMTLAARPWDKGPESLAAALGSEETFSGLTPAGPPVVIFFGPGHVVLAVPLTGQATLPMGWRRVEVMGSEAAVLRVPEAIPASAVHNDAAMARVEATGRTPMGIVVHVPLPDGGTEILVPVAN